MGTWAGRRTQVVLPAGFGVAVLVELALSLWTGKWSVDPIHPALVVVLLQQLATQSRILDPTQLISARILALMLVGTALTLISAVEVWPSSSTGDKVAAFVATAGALGFSGQMAIRSARAKLAAPAS